MEDKALKELHPLYRAWCEEETNANEEDELTRADFERDIRGDR